jgi:pre-mRNA-splicing helicase BRR2
MLRASVMPTQVRLPRVWERELTIRPDIEVSHQVLDAGDLKAGTPIKLQVDIERDEDEDDISEQEQQGGYAVVAPFYPSKKIENWWLVVVQEGGKNDQLLSIKKVPLLRKHRAVLEWTSSKGAHDLILSGSSASRPINQAHLCAVVVCDSYIGDDKEIPFSIEVGEGSESSDEESSADGNSDVEMEG